MELFNGVESLFFRMQRVDDSEGHTRWALSMANLYTSSGEDNKFQFPLFCHNKKRNRRRGERGGEGSRKRKDRQIGTPNRQGYLYLPGAMQVTAILGKL